MADVSTQAGINLDILELITELTDIAEVVVGYRRPDALRERIRLVRDRIMQHKGINE